MVERRQWLMIVLVVAALVAPAVLDRDSFPLSTYPMYSRSRGEVVAIATANGVTESGDVLRLSLQTIGDIDDPLIVEALLRDAIAGGPDETETLCREIAGRVEPAAGFDRISLVTERHDVVDHASGQPSLVSREEHTSCRVR